MEKTPLVANLLAKSGIPYTHLNAGTPKEWKLLLNVIITFNVEKVVSLSLASHSPYSLLFFKFFFRSVIDF